MSNPLPPRLNEIAKLLDLPRPPLVVVVGAGVSLGASGLPYASWPGLLIHGINYLVQRQFQPQWGIQLESTLEASFSPFNLKSALQHAELVEQALNTPDATAFSDWLISTFSNFKAKDDGQETLEVLRDLQEAGALLLTTNYDGLLSDITNLPPVTWEEHPDFLRVITRQKPGILHIHGHWQRPSSIVLGRSSYDRVVADEDFQQLFKTLWLEYSWLYVGCGDGLDDPNLGRLLEWGKRWGESAMPDYFLAREDKAIEIDNRAEKPKNLASIGYPSYEDLPKLLLSITPSARSWPFVPVDEEFPLFRSPGSDIPFPTRQEYLDGDVPTLEADAEVTQRLLTHGWACVLDLASVGKTTLALRIATLGEQRERPVFYFDLKTEILDDAEGRPGAALRRLARPGVLLILDNIHHQPELARQVWQQWKADPRESRLLIVATRIQPHLLTTPEQDLIFFEKHPTNPAILLALKPDDFGRIAKHIHRCIGGASGPPMPEPPKEALAAWYHDFRAALNAFTFAVMSRLADLQKERWELPPSAASAWVREKWLKSLDDGELENAICLAAFGAQELEMFIRDEALPHPGKTSHMLNNGLIVRANVGRFGEYSQFSLREPGWGRLIISALEPPRDAEMIRFNAAARYPITAVVLDRRLNREGFEDQSKRLWKSLDANKATFLAGLLNDSVSLQHLALAMRAVENSDEADLCRSVWQTLEDQPDELIARVREASLQSVAAFLDKAQGHPVVTRAMWEALESETGKLVARMWETPLQFVAAFLDKAQGHPVVTRAIWEALESETGKLVARMWETPWQFVAVFLDKAQGHPVVTRAIWEALESETGKLVSRMWETTLQFVAAFLDTAQGHPVVTRAIWEALESETGKLVDLLWRTGLGELSAFLDKAQGHPVVTRAIWEALESETGKLVARMWETPWQFVAVFLDKTQGHPVVTRAMWEALESDTGKLVARMWETPLQFVAAFLDKAQGHPVVTRTIWEALESDTAKLVDLLWRTGLGEISAFLDKAQGRPLITQAIWRALEEEPENLIELVWRNGLGEISSFLDKAQGRPVVTQTIWQALEKEPGNLIKLVWRTGLGETGAFLERAQAHPLVTQEIWQALEEDSGKLDDRAWETTLNELGSFLIVAQKQGREMNALWESIRSQPDKLADRAWETPLGDLGSFFGVAKQQSQSLDALVQMLENDAARLSQRGLEAKLDGLVGFAHHAPSPLLAIAVRDIMPGHWKLTPVAEGMAGATWLASKCGSNGRNDLADDLLALLLSRANWRDFPPQSGGFGQACWLLANVSPGATERVDPFLDTVCSNKWLTIAYAAATCGQLASGLRQIALHQPVERCRRFHHRALGGRLYKELTRFGMLKANDQSQIIQFLGSAALCGWAVSLQSLKEVETETMAALPANILPHRPNATRVESMQLQLWLGLRTFVSIKKIALPIPQNIIQTTLDLWNENLTETSLEPTTTLHKLNVSMISWLETCLTANPTALIPSKEPLWTLVGFPVRLDLHRAMAR